MREEHRCDVMRKNNTGRRRGNGVYEYGVFTMAVVAVVFHLCLHVTLAAPTAYDSLLPHSGEIAEYFSNNEYISGCYYNFQRYEEGDRIVTNEPCLNCTCHNRMLMCYLRVCPFTKAIGQDCTIEKKPDQCCPIITCPEVPVKLLTSSTTSSPTPTTQTTEIGFHDNYGCSIDDSFYADGAQVPSDPRKPCELCYCIRNRTACVMQECTLHVEGCKPVYQDGICCPVRYDCDYEKEIVSTPRLQTSGGVIKSTTYATVIDCQYGNQSYSDGELITTDKPCEHCYCMRGDIVCAVQDCGEPLRGKDCVPTMPPPEKCCPSSYDCTNDTSSTTESITKESNFYNTEATTVISKSTPYAVHMSSVLTPEEIYTKLGENKVPSLTNSTKLGTSSAAHPSEGIQMDSNNIDAEEHFPTTITTHKYSSSSPVNQFSTAGEIHTTNFEKYPLNGEPQTTVIIGDVPTTIVPDFSSISTFNEGNKVTSKPNEYQSSTSISGEDFSSVTTPTYTKLAGTTKYNSNEITKHSIDKMTTLLEKSTESHLSDANEIIDENIATNKPNDNELKNPENIFTKVPVELNTKTTEKYDISTDIHKLETTTNENGATETKNTISNKNTEPFGPNGENQLNQHVIPNKGDFPITQIEQSTSSPLNGISDKESFETTHQEDTLNDIIKETTPTVISSIVSDSNVITDLHTESSYQTTSHYGFSNALDIGATSTSTSFEGPESNKEPINTTINPLTLDNVSTTLTTSEGINQELSTHSPQTTSTNQPIFDKSDATTVKETNIHHTTVENIISQSNIKKPSQEVNFNDNNTAVPFTKQSVSNDAYQTASTFEITTTISPLISTTQPEVNYSSELPSSISTSVPDTSAIIPGEGSCLVDGITYANASIIESSNPCHSKCVCLSSIPTCTLITCSNPPPNDPKCMPVQIKPESCCPVYICGSNQTMGSQPMPSANQIGPNEIEINTIKQSNLTSELIPTYADSSTNIIGETSTSAEPNSIPVKPQIFATTHIPETFISDEIHETHVHNDEEEISNEVLSSTEASSTHSNIKNSSYPIPLLNNGTEPTIPLYESPSENNSHNELFDINNNGAGVNNVIVTTEADNLIYFTSEETHIITKDNASTNVQLETTTINKIEIEDSNEINASSEYEKEITEISPIISSSSEFPITSSPINLNTMLPNIITDNILATNNANNSGNEYFEIKVTTNEPSQNIKDETTTFVAEHDHDIYSTSSEYFTVTDDSNDIITAPNTPISHNFNEKSTEVPSLLTYETTLKPQFENEAIETTINTLDHSEITGIPTTVTHEVHQNEVSSEEYPQSLNIVTSTIENKVQEKLSTPSPSFETEAYQSTSTGSSLPISTSSEILDKITGNYETTIIIDDVATTKIPTAENSFSTNMGDIVSSTISNMLSTTSDQGYEVTKIVTQTIINSSETTHNYESMNTKTTLLPQQSWFNESSNDNIITTIVPAYQSEITHSEEHPYQVFNNVSENEGNPIVPTKQPYQPTNIASEFTGEIGQPTEQLSYQTDTPSHQNEVVQPEQSHQTPNIALENQNENSQSTEQPQYHSTSNELPHQSETIQPNGQPHQHINNEFDHLGETSQPSQEPHYPLPAEVVQNQNNGNEQPSYQTPLPSTVTEHKDVDPTMVSSSSSSYPDNIPDEIISFDNHTLSPPSSTQVSYTYPPIQQSTWTRKPIDEESTSEPNYYPQPPMYPPGIENANIDGSTVDEYEDENGSFGPGTCRYAGKVYVSAQQIPRDDPCDFCFCFRSDIICLQQSCPPPIHGCRQEPIQGFCCPRYECPVSSYGSSHNITLPTTVTTTTTTTTTATPSRPPRYPLNSFRNAVRRTGCVIHGYFYNVGNEIPIASGPCLECICGANGQMKCDPKSCSPEPHVQQMMVNSK